MNLTRETEFKLLKIARDFSCRYPSAYNVADEAKVLLEVQETFRDCLLSIPFPLEDIKTEECGSPIFRFTWQEEEGRLKALKTACKLGWRISTLDSQSATILQEVRDAYRILSVRLLENRALGIGRINHVPSRGDEVLVPIRAAGLSTLPEEAGHLDDGANAVQVRCGHEDSPSPSDAPSNSTSEGRRESVAQDARTDQKGAE